MDVPAEAEPLAAAPDAKALAQLAERLTQLLRLRTFPIGLKLFESVEAMEAVPGLRRPPEGKTFSTCQLVTQAQRTNLSELNNYLSANGLPAIETYDRQHNGRRFLPANVAVFFGNTGQARTGDLPAVAWLAEASQEVLPNTVGRYAIGRVGGHRASDPGRIAKLIAKLEEMPYFVKAEGKTTSGPEVTAPRGFTSLVL